jgi:hypothetical protein
LTDIAILAAEGCSAYTIIGGTTLHPAFRFTCREKELAVEVSGGSRLQGDLVAQALEAPNELALDTHAVAFVEIRRTEVGKVHAPLST